VHDDFAVTGVFVKFYIVEIEKSELK